MSVVSTPAVLLRSFNYSETSRVLRLYTKDLGLVSVMAKGIRRAGAHGQGGIDTFSRGGPATSRPSRSSRSKKRVRLSVETCSGSPVPRYSRRSCSYTPGPTRAPRYSSASRTRSGGSRRSPG